MERREFLAGAACGLAIGWAGGGLLGGGAASAPEPPAVSTPTASPEAPAGVAASLEDRLNRARKQDGAGRAEVSGRLSDMAEYHARRMARAGEAFETGPSGEGPVDRYKLFGLWSGATEGQRARIEEHGMGAARGGTSGMNAREASAALVTSLMKTAGGRALVLEPAWRAVGAGVSAGADGVLHASAAFL
jgi:uncharacterized protein YkwD